MKNFKSRIISMVILSTIIGCTPPGNATVKPNMTADFQTIKVGQTITITMTAPTAAVTGGNPNQTQIDTGFIYSPKSNQLANEPIAPYLYEGISDKLYPGAEPNLFPIDSDIEVTTPATGSDNVPPRVSTTKVGDQSQVSFTIKGKSAGIAMLRGAFLNTRVEFPDQFKRTPFRPEYDGEITIQIVP